MKTYLKSEKGYALLLTVAVLILFSILGLSLLTLTASGVKKNENRQYQIQSRDLADKGITFIVEETQQYFEAALSNAIKSGQSGITKDAFKSLLETAIDKRNIKCNTNKFMEIQGNDGNMSKVCIENIGMVSNNEKDAFKRIVTYRSTGISGGKEFTVRQDIILGTDAVPDQLRYAVSTNEGGNLYFHGGVEVQGDIKSDGNIYINKNAHWVSGSSTKWENSVALKSIPDNKSITSKFILTNENNNIYYYERLSGDFKSYQGLTPTQTIKISDSNKIATLKSRLTDSNNIAFITKDTAGDSVNISKRINDIYPLKSMIKKEYNNLNITTNSHETSKLVKTDNILITDYSYETKKVCSGKKCTDTQVITGLKNSSFTINGNNKNIKLLGSYYVNGDVKIENTNLESDAILYVDGTVSIKDSTLKGISPESTLIIFATGNIEISNISEYDTTASKIKGFFYTKEDMIMYGVGSNVQITGGLSAKNLRLTALRGNVTTLYRKKWIIWPFYYELELTNITAGNANTQTASPSRLKIIYDENLIAQYTSFERGLEEEFITSINEPQIMERY
ncbi:hypothetical protein [Solibacillus isronensis]|uniref:hypothetical protein n=1 Tax=Solibacillus isronensis TaxID=412383 RepID=UPI0039A23057